MSIVLGWMARCSEGLVVCVGFDGVDDIVDAVSLKVESRPHLALEVA